MNKDANLIFKDTETEGLLSKNELLFEFNA